MPLLLPKPTAARNVAQFSQVWKLLMLTCARPIIIPPRKVQIRKRLAVTATALLVAVLLAVRHLFPATCATTRSNKGHIYFNIWKPIMASATQKGDSLMLHFPLQAPLLILILSMKWWPHHQQLPDKWSQTTTTNSNNFHFQDPYFTNRLENHKFGPSLDFRIQCNAKMTRAVWKVSWDWLTVGAFLCR